MTQQTANWIRALWPPSVALIALAVVWGTIGERLATAESDICQIQTLNVTQDTRIAAVEAATATLPIMAQDIREIRAQINDILNLLIEQQRQTRD